MGITYDAIPDPQRVDAGQAGSLTADNPKVNATALAAANRYARPHTQADDDAPAVEPGQQRVAYTPPAPPASAAPAPSNAVTRPSRFKYDAPNDVTPQSPFAMEDSDLGDQQREIETGQGLAGGKYAAGIVAGEGLGGVVGGAIAAKRMAQAAEVAAKINAAQDAAHIAAVAKAVAPAVTDDAAFSSGVARMLKEDAEKTAMSRPPPEGGAPAWKIPGQLPKPPVDVTGQQILDAASKAQVEAQASKSAIGLMKDPRFVGAIFGAMGGAGVPAAMAGYHAIRTLKIVSRIFGE